MKRFDFMGQAVAIIFALVLISSAAPVAARPDSGLQIGAPQAEVTVVKLIQPLSVGITGDQVRQLQISLKKLGYFPTSVDTTGYYGPITARAVSSFQLAKGLISTSVVDSATWTKVSEFASLSAPTSSCLADFDNNGSANTLDITAYLNAWAVLDQSADFDGNGLVDSDDFKMFMVSWNQGCQEKSTTPCDLVDFNDDGITNTLDITAYLNVWTQKDASADMNGDTVIDESDFTAFLDLWKQCAL